MRGSRGETQGLGLESKKKLGTGLGLAPGWALLLRHLLVLEPFQEQGQLPGLEQMWLELFRREQQVEEG